MDKLPITTNTVESDADTQPTYVVRSSSRKDTAWQDVIGWFCLAGAIIFTGATVVVLTLPIPTVDNQPADEQTESTAVASIPTAVIVTSTNESLVALDNNTDLPTMSPDQTRMLLLTPPSATDNSRKLLESRDYNPFTIIPERPRNEVTRYIVQQGDTITSIAEEFNLQPETIAWSNQRSYVQVLRPGDALNILPVDGVYHTAIGSTTINKIATQYDVDPNIIIDSPYNSVSMLSPDDILPSGTRLVVEGGTAEAITWNPTVVRTTGSNGSGLSGSNGQISFASGDPGSCGLIENPGGGASWVRPIDNFTWIRGFAAWHPAVDLAANEGTPIYAANSGRVIFAGWSNYGYGYAVVIAHGPFTTLYAHMSSISVSCNQDVVAGQQIGASGNSGNSSGPHLHFEIRYQDAPQDPTYTISF